MSADTDKYDPALGVYDERPLRAAGTAPHPAAGDKVRVTDELAEKFGYAMHGEAWKAGAYGIRERYKARYRAALEAIAQPQEADRG